MLMNIQGVDLNLLKVLVAVEKSGGVTKAAQELGLGQPAVSQALSRLRETLKDDLFVRGANGMHPTPKTLEIIGPVRAALAQIDHSLFGESRFDASSYEARFRIGLSDYAAVTLGPQISRRLSKTIPNATLAFNRADRGNAMLLLSDGSIDLAIGFFPGETPWLHKRRLYKEDHVCAFNPALVPIKIPISLEDFTRYRHILVSLSGDPKGFVDDILRRLDRRRRVAVLTPYFLHCVHLLAELPMLATLPRRFVETCLAQRSMAVTPLPFETPAFDVSMMWRAGDDRNPALSALRDVVIASSRA